MCPTSPVTRSGPLNLGGLITPRKRMAVVCRNGYVNDLTGTTRWAH
nr:hypothetical protein [Kibdelosporangium sp. MJ126-NF4]CTQ95217.1 hypothetical protein [Kibdelosporangium sp. MJ126-NF4]